MYSLFGLVSFMKHSYFVSYMLFPMSMVHCFILLNLFVYLLLSNI